MKPNGFIAVARSIFNHPLFRTRPDHLVAWLRLIADAAWKQEYQRGAFGSVQVERGQLVATVRSLARAWGWPKSNVSYFLGQLEAEGMIVCNAVRTQRPTRNGTKNSHRLTIITISNYEKFQTPKNSTPKKAGQTSGQEVRQKRQQAPRAIPQSVPNHSNNQTKDKTGVEKGSRKSKPKHGAQGRGRVWCDYNTEEWTAYAEDFKSVTGADPEPQNRAGGQGKWFKLLGEGAALPIRHFGPARDELEANIKASRRL